MQAQFSHRVCVWRAGGWGEFIFVFASLKKIHSSASRVRRGAGEGSLAATCPRFSNHNQIDGYRVRFGGGGKSRRRGCRPDPSVISRSEVSVAKAPNGDVRRTSFITRAIVKCVPQASGHVCHLNICTGTGLLSSAGTLRTSPVRSPRGGGGGSRRLPPRWASDIRRAFPPPVLLRLGWPRPRAEGGRGGRPSDRCSASLSSRRESVPLAPALAPACSPSASVG